MAGLLIPRSQVRNLPGPCTAERSAENRTVEPFRTCELGGLSETALSSVLSSDFATPGNMAVSGSVTGGSAGLPGVMPLDPAAGQRVVGSSPTRGASTLFVERIWLERSGQLCRQRRVRAPRAVPVLSRDLASCDNGGAGRPSRTATLQRANENTGSPTTPRTSTILIPTGSPASSPFQLLSAVVTDRSRRVNSSAGSSRRASRPRAMAR